MIRPKHVTYSTPNYSPLSATPTGSTIRAKKEGAESKGKEKGKEKVQDKGKGKEKDKDDEDHEEDHPKEAEEEKKESTEKKEEEPKKVVQEEGGDASSSKNKEGEAGPSSPSSKGGKGKEKAAKGLEVKKAKSAPSSPANGPSRKKPSPIKKKISGDSESDSENESGSEFKTISSFSESESDGGRSMKDKIDREEGEARRAKKTTRLSVRRGTVHKQRDLEKERRKLRRLAKENAQRGKKEKIVLPTIEESSTENETELVEIEVEDDARDDALFDPLMRLQPVPPLFPKRKNKYLLLRIDDHPSRKGKGNYPPSHLCLFFSSFLIFVFFQKKCRSRNRTRSC